MKEGLIAFRELFISDQKLAKSVEPGVRRLHDPASVLRRASSSALLSCDPWRVASDAYLLTNGLAIVSLIRIQELLRSLGKGNDDGIEHGHQLTDVMSMCSGNDQRQRDATGVHQYMPFAALFFPGLSGSDQSLLGQEVL
jgi:hypothetical protein